MMDYIKFLGYLVLWSFGIYGCYLGCRDIIKGKIAKIILKMFLVWAFVDMIILFALAMIARSYDFILKH